MRIQYTERDRHLVRKLRDGLWLLDRTSPLARILEVAYEFDGPREGVVSIVSTKCSRCGTDVFGVNPCRDDVESVGWCGCKGAT